jgi:hypothetical protein
MNAATIAAMARGISSDVALCILTEGEAIFHPPCAHLRAFRQTAGAYA